MYKLLRGILGWSTLSCWGQNCLLVPLVLSPPFIFGTQAMVQEAMLMCLGMHPVSLPADNRYLTPLVCIGFMALIPVWVLVARQSPPIMKILKFGWFPIILAMVISR